MKYISICSGIEAASVAWHSLGWTPLAFAEIEAFPSAVLKHHYPDVPNWGDMTKYRAWPEEILADCDILVGGPPCQAFSVAGLRNSLADERGNLTLVYVHLINHIDDIRRKHGRPPIIAVYENVPGLLSTPDNAFGCLLGALAGEEVPLVPPREGWSNAGGAVGPDRTVAYRILDAQYFGVAQRRRRVFVVASAGDRVDPVKVLFVEPGVPRHTPPSREKGKGFAAVAGTLAANGGGLNRPAGNANELDFCIPVAGTGIDEFGIQQTVGTLCLDTHPGAYSGQDAYTGRLIPSLAQPIAPALTASNDPSRRNAPMCFQQCSSSPKATMNISTESCQSITTGADHQMVLANMQVRRLTPVECERLQGFPDGYTEIPWRGRPAKYCPDGSRYKALGNSMAVPVMRWIGERISQHGGES